MIMTAQEVLQRSYEMNKKLGQSYGALQKCLIAPLIKVSQGILIQELTEKNTPTDEGEG